MCKNKIRFAVIGCGRMGMRRMESIVNHPDSELVCIADIASTDAHKASEKFFVPCYDSFQSVLDRDDVDGVVLSVPNKYHASTAIAFLEKGKHVFCEKPMARNVEEARAMVDAASKSKGVLKVGSNLRYFPSVLKAKELLDQGAIGKTLFLRTWIGHNGWNLGETWFSDPEMAGGGTFLDNGAHILDLTRWFIGEVKSGVGRVQTALWQIAPVEDNGYGLFEMVGGQTAMIQASWTEWSGYMYMEIYGADGSIMIDNRNKDCKTVLATRNGGRTEFDFSMLPANSYKLEWQDFMRALLDGQQPQPSGYDGLRSVEMAFAVYESSRTGCRVDL